MKIETLESLSAQRRAELLDRGRGRLEELRPRVRDILADVRTRGDAALRDYTERFDGVRLESPAVAADAIAAAVAAADPAYLAALRQAMGTIEAFHRAHLQAEVPVETTTGVRVWRAWRPLERVGIYVPGGGALYPSCLLMAAVPARVAGCSNIVVCTPPGPDGLVPDAVLVAAGLAGVTEVYAVGGAQAIAAMAYGTESLPRVDKIFGAGSSYVAAAKVAVAGDVAIDLPAGPTEIFIVADDTANASWVAADLLAQGEHGPESALMLVTTSASLAEAVNDEIARQLPSLPTAPTIEAALSQNSAILLAASLDAALDFANAYAPEHLELVVREPEAWVERVRHAGSVFLGGWSPEAAGDYATGGNHTLPTSMYARSFGPLSLEDFGRKIQVQMLTPDGLAALGDCVQTLATIERLPAHAASVQVRFASAPTGQLDPRQASVPTGGDA